MEEFLNDLGLHDLVGIFKENDVTLEIAKRLTDEEIKGIIASIGKRKIFKEAIHRINEESYITENITSDFEINSNCFLVDVTNSDNDNTSSLLVSHSPSTSGTSTKSIDYHEAIVENHREVAFCGLENAFKPILFPYFDLKTLLESCPLGLLVINYYEKHNCLDNSKRTLLVDIVCKKIYNYVVKHRLIHSDYNVLTAKIITLFPTETAGTYYVPAVSKRNSSQISYR
ncbi:uncharacterized protein [Leptinotarsa decemlineata]|uniref:uncharacterized protein n=1 Tax=Leptinotarsa decemlineata TaxID=7539 RepID=UPI003D30D4B6